MARFHREAQIARSLMHPNICALLDHGVTSEGTPYHVMEFIQGETLEDVLGEIKQLNPVEAVPIFIKVCRAIQYLHSRGIVHRDLKPANVMLIVNETANMGVKVIDFGVAKGTRRGVHDQMDLTRPGEVFGSLLYTAPERFLAQQADERSDIYSLGCLMYESLCGENPFSANGPSAIVEKQLKHNPEPLSSFGMSLPVALQLQPLITKTLQKNPADRFQTVADLRMALERVETPVKMAFISTDPTRQTKSHPRQRQGSAWVVKALKLVGAGAGLAAGLVLLVKLYERLEQMGFKFPLGW